MLERNSIYYYIYIFSSHFHLIEYRAKFQLPIKLGIVWYQKHVWYDKFAMMGN